MASDKTSMIKVLAAHLCAVYVFVIVSVLMHLFTENVLFLLCHLKPFLPSGIFYTAPTVTLHHTLIIAQINTLSFASSDDFSYLHSALGYVSSKNFCNGILRCKISVYYLPEIMLVFPLFLY